MISPSSVFYGWYLNRIRRTDNIETFWILAGELEVNDDRIRRFLEEELSRLRYPTPFSGREELEELDLATAEARAALEFSRDDIDFHLKASLLGKNFLILTYLQMDI